MRRVVFFIVAFTLFGLKADLASNKHCRIELPATYSGFFASFLSVLGALEVFEKEQYPGVRIAFSSGHYFDSDYGDNWWEYYFEPIDIGDVSIPAYVCNTDDYMYLALHAYPKSPHRANQLIKKYIHLKPHIQAELNTFVETQFMGRYVIGVHHRGTDKIKERQLVPYKKTYKALKKEIDKLSHLQKKKLRIFVATDEKQFIDYLKEKFQGKVVHGDFSRSTTSQPLHYGKKEHYAIPYLKGKEALLDCLLLSKCHVLIRPAGSCLSIVAPFFNPSIRTITLDSMAKKKSKRSIDRKILMLESS